MACYSVVELLRNPRELWLVLAISVGECLATFSTFYILSKYLTDVLEYSDIAVGTILGCMTGMQFVFGLVMTPLLDGWGVRVCLCLGCYGTLSARLMLWLFQSHWATMCSLCVLWPAGASLVFSSLMIGIKRYSRKDGRSEAYGLYYISFNVSSFGAAIIVHLSRVSTLAHGITSDTEANHGMYSPILGFSVVVTALIAVMSHLLRNIAVDDETGEERAPVYAGSGWANLKEAYASSAFWRFTAVIMLFILLRMIFGHMKATVPKWMTRAFGEGTPYELYIGLNGLLVIFLVPVLSMMTKAVQLSLEATLTCGAWVSGLSPGCIVLMRSEIGVLAFIVVFSVGEAMWSPRLLEYAASVPKEGKEGVFAVLSLAPLYLAKFLAGIISGFLLTAFCPSPQPACRSCALWSTILVMSAATPLALTVTRQLLFPPASSDKLKDKAAVDESWPLLKDQTQG